MSAPVFDHSKSPVSNLEGLAASLSVPSIAKSAIEIVVQLFSHFVRTALALEGTLSVAGLSTLTGGVAGGVQALSGAGAVNLTTLATKVTSTGANALTLADGAAGQIKIVTLIVDGGDATLTPATKTGFSSITFDSVGDSVILQFHTTIGWVVIGSNGVTVNA